MPNITVKQLKAKRHMNPNSLANLKPRKPGECPNPHGRPPNERCITACLRVVANQQISKKVAMSKMTFAQAAAFVHWQKAVKGDMATYEFITERLEGKAQASVDLTTKGKAIDGHKDIPDQTYRDALVILASSNICQN